MNRRMLSIIALFVVISVSLIVSVIAYGLEKTSYQDLRKGFRTISERQLDLVMSALRQNILLGDLRNAQAKLNAELSKEFLVGYEIIAKDDISSSIKYLPDQKTNFEVITKKVTFSQDGSEWGTIRFYLNSATFEPVTISLRYQLMLRISFLVSVLSLCLLTRICG